VEHRRKGRYDHEICAFRLPPESRATRLGVKEPGLGAIFEARNTFAEKLARGEATGCVARTFRISADDKAPNSWLDIVSEVHRRRHPD
jgi:hypothetical protein